ncbi:hypothetical protein EX30DRAFT_392553 [Ascodesmis nigricans]|uniref:Oxo-4-hydroxy-4-carboxy-5-ureidoimidazoline decarboxylase domain-containing protein n=1 Tax=Ascodesmis nigricans TaxID=341454 RepID=A0A4S2N7F7_9PEZI|nr:hypothetical protein EX30DRAFT_392553 [Ascodesmis nigricans]
MSLPPIASLSSSPEHLQKILDLLFEPCPTLYTLIASSLPRTFSSYPEFIDFAADKMLSLVDDEDKIQKIIAAHPRLGAKKVDSKQSSEEQKSLQQGAEEEKRKLEKLNNEYEGKFEGLRYVVFVAGRPREEVMKDMRERIDRGDREAEKKAAIKAMRDIAKDRASKLQ